MKYLASFILAWLVIGFFYLTWIYPYIMIAMIVAGLFGALWAWCHWLITGEEP